MQSIMHGYLCDALWVSLVWLLTTLSSYGLVCLSLSSRRGCSTLDMCC